MVASTVVGRMPLRQMRYPLTAALSVDAAQLMDTPRPWMSGLAVATTLPGVVGGVRSGAAATVTWMSVDDAVLAGAAPSKASTPYS